MLDALLDFAGEKLTLRPIFSQRQLALRAGKASKNTAEASLQLLTEIGVLATTDRGSGATQAHLADPLTWLAKVTAGDNNKRARLTTSATETPPEPAEVPSGQSRASITDHFFFSQRKADDPFLSGTSRWSKKNLDGGRPDKADFGEWRRWMEEHQAFGVLALRIVDFLAAGPATGMEIVEALHVHPSSARVKLKLLRRHGIAESASIDGDGPGRRALVFNLVEDWQERIEALRPTLRTHMLGAERSAKAEQDVIAWIGAKEEIEAEFNRQVDADELKRRNRRKARAVKALAGWLQVLDPTLTEAEARELAGQPSQRRRMMAEEKRQRATEDARIELAAERRAEQWENTNRLREAMEQLKAQGQPKKDWVRQLQMAGWTPGEAARAVRWGT